MANVVVFSFALLLLVFAHDVLALVSPSSSTTGTTSTRSTTRKVVFSSTISVTVKSTFTTFTSGTIVLSSTLLRTSTLLPTSTVSVYKTRVFNRVLTALPQTTLTVTTSCIDVIPFEVLPPVYRQRPLTYHPATLTLATTVYISQPAIYKYRPASMQDAPFLEKMLPEPSYAKLDHPSDTLMRFVLNKDGVHEMVCGYCTTIVACRPKGVPTFSLPNNKEQIEKSFSLSTLTPWSLALIALLVLI